jgi:hypothetical protein
MSERDELIAIGFVADDDGILRAPVGSVVTLKPIAQFYELKIVIGSNVLFCIIAQIALKISATPEPIVIDVDALIGK